MDTFDALLLTVSIAIGWGLGSLARAWKRSRRSQGERRRQALERINRNL